MTSPIGPTSNPFPNALNPTRGAKNTNTAANAENAPSQQDTVRPTPPAGPLGQNINTTA
jgi:hypothetical protein